MIYIGPSGFSYDHWVGTYYPADLPREKWLSYIGSRFNACELNATFYQLQPPERFEEWAAAVPKGFRFAVKGNRYLTHTLRIKEPQKVRQALANFFGSGVLILGERLGAFLWQFPPNLTFDPVRFASFLELLPRTASGAERLAREAQPERLPGQRVAPGRARGPLHHAIEIRHPSFLTADFFELLKTQKAAFVIADTAGLYPFASAVTAPFLYVRLHGSRELYASSYTRQELGEWKARVDGWLCEIPHEDPDAYIFFDNDARGYAPLNAELLQSLWSPNPTPREAAQA